jgi:hypothetical protein
MPKKGAPKRQLTAYVRAELKVGLAERAAREDRPVRELLEEAIDRFLAPSAEEPAPKRA